MTLVWYLLWFVVAVGLLVTVHEFGHFWVARRLGFKVLRFSVGFGRPLLTRVAGPDRMEYVLAAIPLGGYVKMLDEREGPVDPADLPRSFTHRPPWQRIVVLLAGPAFNILFAVLVLWGMLWVNGVTEVRPTVGDVTAGSIAAHAGLQVRRRDPRHQRHSGHRAARRGVRAARCHERARRSGPAGAPADGGSREARLDVPDAAERRRLTEPSELFRGLGFQFWTPPVPPVLGQVTPDGPAARAGLHNGDRIIAIDGVPVTRLPPDRPTTSARGPARASAWSTGAAVPATAPPCRWRARTSTAGTSAASASHRRPVSLTRRPCCCIPISVRRRRSDAPARKPGA